jgi:hypothetical protein
MVDVARVPINFLSIRKKKRVDVRSKCQFFLALIIVVDPRLSAAKDENLTDVATLPDFSI